MACRPSLMRASAVDTARGRMRSEASSPAEDDHRSRRRSSVRTEKPPRARAWVRSRASRSAPRRTARRAPVVTRTDPRARDRRARPITVAVKPKARPTRRAMDAAKHCRLQPFCVRSGAGWPCRVGSSHGHRMVRQRPQSKRSEKHGSMNSKTTAFAAAPRAIDASSRSISPRRAPRRAARWMLAARACSWRLLPP